MIRLGRLVLHVHPTLLRHFQIRNNGVARPLFEPSHTTMTLDRRKKLHIWYMGSPYLATTLSLLASQFRVHRKLVVE